MFLHKTQTYTYTQYLWLPFRSWTFDQYDFIGSPTKLTSLCRFSTILVSKRWPCWEENMENWKKNLPSSPKLNEGWYHRTSINLTDLITISHIRIFIFCSAMTQVGGWSQIYKGLTFVSVTGAGHEVPLHRPRQAFILFRSFLANKPMPSWRTSTFISSSLLPNNGYFYVILSV